MQIVTVIPLAPGVFKEVLTYFTTQRVERGILVSIPVRNRIIDALVIDHQPVADIRSSVRQADYPLKKIVRVKPTRLFSPEFLLAAKRAADYFACPLGQILHNLVPTDVLQADWEPATLTDGGRRPSGGKYVLQDTDEERLSYYKGIVREEFSRGGSVLVCLPTITEIEKMMAILEKGIGQYSVIIHSELGTKKLLEAWQKALTTTHPILVITTPFGLSLPRPDLRTIILDRENTDYYKSRTRPFVDYRIFAEFLAEAANLRLIMGDIVLRTETIWRLGQGRLETPTPTRHHIISGAAQQVINLKKQEPRDEPFRVLGEELLAAVARSHERGERSFIFVHHRGFNPVIICQDCSSVLTCENCAAPISLHEGSSEAPEEKYLLCHHCGNRASAAARCQTCSGWRLLGLGIGTQLVLKELEDNFPRLKLFKLSSDSTKTSKRAFALVNKFLDTPGSVLVGTEMAVNYLKEKVEMVAVAAIESMFALPDYRVNDRIFNLLLRLRSLAGKHYFIQERNLKSPLFDYAGRGALIDFHRGELADRKEFGYPPFRLFIKISLAAPRAEGLLAMKELEQKLSGYDNDSFPAFPATNGRETRFNLVLRLPPRQWPNTKLLSILKALPPKFTVNVGPESLTD